MENLFFYGDLFKGIICGRIGAWKIVFVVCPGSVPELQAEANLS